MSTRLLYTARLDQPVLDNLKTLENELGLTLVAVEVSEPQKPAQLDEAQIKRIREFEEKSGKVILAYN